MVLTRFPRSPHAASQIPMEGKDIHNTIHGRLVHRTNNLAQAPTHHVEVRIAVESVGLEVGIGVAHRTIDLLFPASVRTLCLDSLNMASTTTPIWQPSREYHFSYAKVRSRSSFGDVDHT